MKTALRLIGLSVVFGLGLLLLPAGASAADEKVGPSDKQVKEVRDKAIAYLRKQQGKDGGFSLRFRTGVTALVVAALARNGVPTDDPTMKKALDFLTSKVKKNGGIYEDRLANYVTSVGIMALVEANSNGKFDTIIKNASTFLKKLQHDDVASKDVSFGGVGYEGKGKDKRCDLSNTQMFLDALLKAGVPKNDPAVKNALKFISRCQNFPDKEKGNDQAFATKAKADDKGGFVYIPDPDDKMHSNGEGGLRSLGAMTYGGLKSFLYAGVDKKDPRVQGAVKWMRKHYTLEENPGQKNAGLYYYYHTFGKAMEAWGEDNFKDADGKAHDWRKDLYEALKKRQQENGSFINKGDRTFGELDANLATAFALLSLSYTKK